MKAILNILSVITSLIVGLLFSLLITFSPILLATSTIVTQREIVKEIINSSKLSAIIAQQISTNALKQLTESGVPKKTINSLKPTVEKIISPEYIQKNVVSVVDGTYDWLENKSESIKINTSQLELNEKLSKLIPKEYLKNEDIMKTLNMLKPCTLEQAKKLENLSKLDSLETLCIPPNLDISKLIDNSYNQNIADKSIQVDSMFAVPDTTSDYANLVKTVFGLLTYLPYILLSLGVILASIFIFLPPSQLPKAYILSIFTILVGLINYILFKSTDLISTLVNFLITQGDLKSNDIPLEVIQSIVITLLSKIWETASTYSLYILFLGIFLTIITVVTNIILNKKKST